MLDDEQQSLAPVAVVADEPDSEVDSEEERQGAVVVASKAREASSSPGKKTLTRPVRTVWAVYEDLVASLVVKQTRLGLKGELPGVFCRAERGS